jgi:hypothetical protein
LLLNRDEFKVELFFADAETFVDCDVEIDGWIFKYYD